MHEDVDDVIVITASNSWTDKRMADHQLAAALSAHTRILFVDPSGFRPPSVSEETHGTAHVTVIRPMRLPFVRLAFTQFLSRFLIAWQIRRALRRMMARRTTLLEGNVMFPVTGLIDESTAVYWAQDDWQGLAPLIGVDPVALDRNERRVLARSHSVVAANPLVAERLRTAHNNVHLIPFGASTDLFSRAGDSGRVREDEDRPAILMGTLNSRIDYSILDAIVRAGVPLLIAGPIDTAGAGSRLAALQDAGRVEYLGAVDFDQLPSVLAQCSVGIVPYDRSRFNLGSFPLKTIEYLAAGLPVVATDLPAISWLQCDDVHVANDPTVFANVTRELWRQGPPDAQDRARRRQFARGHDWSERAVEFLGVLEEAGLTRRAGALS
ncbi:glycosyltransferase [Microbacterium profundi]|uniref:Glycosyltransferase n=1 Tax=Microbacterium profundi TaxID=450380 RepID=A0ABV3LJK6_9MICO|nr:glycosyltransferase [Microbacterium profundi]